MIIPLIIAKANDTRVVCICFIKSSIVKYTKKPHPVKITYVHNDIAVKVKSGNSQAEATIKNSETWLMMA